MDQIEQWEQENPNDIDEMPVKTDVSTGVLYSGVKAAQ